jgi:replicative DNA helicase
MKQQPQNIEIEEQVIGTILSQSNSFNIAINIINKDCFYNQRLQDIFVSILSLYSTSKPIDIVSVSNTLRNNNKLDSIGGLDFLIGLSDKTSNKTSFEYHCYILLELHERRSGILTANKLIDGLYDLSTDIDENMVTANQVILSLSNEVSNIGGISLGESIIELIREQENELKGDFNGCRSKFVDLDKLIVGFKNQQMIIVAGRPGMGKTTFGINIAYRLAKFENTPVGFFSLEMSSTELTKKFAAIESQICNSRITNLDEPILLDYFKKAQNIAQLPIYIDDKAGSTIDEIRSRAITMKRKHNVEIIFIDYLQLISSKGSKGTRENEISEISRKIKLLAKELNIPIVAISQLSRAVETADPKVPYMHHLRESGSIEQDADMVLMLWRPEYYDYKEFDYNDVMQDSKGKCVTYVRKNRNGDIGKALLNTNLAVSSFYDIVDNFSVNRDYF